MSVADILLTAQDYLLDSGETITLEASIPEMIETLARLIPVFGGIGIVYNFWQVGQYAPASGGATYMDVTALAQGEGGAFNLSTAATGTGLLLGASGAFDRVAFTLTSGAVGDDQRYEWTYWNGRQWAPLPVPQPPTFATPGVQTLVFPLPSDWVAGVPEGVIWPAGVEQVAFWLRLRAAVPPSTPARCDQVALTRRFFPLPGNILQLLSVHFFPRELEPAGVRWALDTLDPSWRTRTGTPTRYTQELETTQRLRLHPSPTMQGTMGFPPFQGIPGALPPTHHLVTMQLVAPDVVDLAPWWEDLVAYLLAAWEATREGVREDVPQAQALMQLVGGLVGLLKDLHHAPGEELVESAWEMPVWWHWPLGRQP